MSNDVPFHTTPMGQRYCRRLVEQIRRLAEAVERVVEEKRTAPPADGPPAT